MMGHQRPIFPILAWIWTLAFSLHSPQVQAFLGMNAGANMQTPQPWWTVEIGSTEAKSSASGMGITTDTSSHVFITGYTSGTLIGTTKMGATDMTLTMYDTSGNKQWSRQLGVASQVTYGYGVAVDNAGGVFVGGQTSGGLDGNTLAGTYDLFVTKYDTSGNKQWTRQLGVATKSVYARAVATDTSGAVFITGNVNGGLDGNTLTGTWDTYLTKYDTSGNKQWTKQLGVATKMTEGRGVATDISGSIFVTGDTAGGLDGNTLAGYTDMFLTKYDSSGTKQWTRQLGVASQGTYGLAVATDISGNAFVSGQTDGGLDGNTVAGAYDFFVTKYDNNGTKQWTRQLGAASAYTYGNGVATDSSGNVYVSGYSNAGMDGNALIGVNDLFITKYDSNGTKLWTKTSGTASKNTYGFAATTDSSGNIYGAGHTDGNLDGNTLTGTTDQFVKKYNSAGTAQWTKLTGGYGAGAAINIFAATATSTAVYGVGNATGGLDGNTVTGVHDGMMTKYDTATGTRQWTTQFGVAGKDTYVYATATDISGNVIGAGITTGGLFGNTQAGTFDLFVSKYDTSGTRQWTKQLGIGSKTTSAQGVATDISGNVFVAGYVNGGLDGNSLTGTYDFFFTKYDSTGTKQWTKQLGVASQMTLGYAVATDVSGSIFITGYTQGGLDGNTLTGTQDLFLTKYNSAGTKQWTKQLGVASKSTTAKGVATDSSGNIYVAGYTTGGLDGNTLAGSQDFFLTKYDSTGTKQWTRQLGVSGATNTVYAVTTDNLGNIYLSGSTTGSLDGVSAPGSTRLFVTKYTSAGVRQWTRVMGATSGTITANGVATDNLGGVYIGGQTNVSGLDGKTKIGTFDSFLIRFGGN